MAELGDFLLGSNPEKRAGDVNVEMLDYGFVEKCGDRDLLRAIVARLKSGKDGRYPDLERAAEERLLQLLPDTERKKILCLRAEPTVQEREEAEESIDDFVKRMGGAGDITDVGGGIPPVRRRHLPSVRGSHSQAEPQNTEGARSSASSSSTQRLGAYDFPAWEKFDVDAAERALDEEEKEREDAGRTARANLELKRAERRRKELEQMAASLKADEMTPLERREAAKREIFKGKECYCAEEWEQAHLHYTRSIALDPSSVAYLRRSLAAEKLKKLEGAEADYTKALELNPACSEAWKGRAEIRHKSGRYKEAIEDYDQAIALEPSKYADLREKSRKKLAEVEGERLGMKAGRTRRKIVPPATSSPPMEEWREVPIRWAELPPPLPAGAAMLRENAELAELAERLKEEGDMLLNVDDRPDLAIKKYDKALEADPTLLKARMNRSLAHFKVEAWERVEEDTTAVLKREPHHVSCLICRGKARLAQGQVAAGADDLNHVLQVDPGNPDARKELDALNANLKHHRSRASRVSFDDGSTPGTPVGGSTLSTAKILEAVNPELAKTQYKPRGVRYEDGTSAGQEGPLDASKIEGDLELVQTNPELARTPWQNRREGEEEEKRGCRKSEHLRSRSISFDDGTFPGDVIAEDEDKLHLGRELRSTRPELAATPWQKVQGHAAGVENSSAQAAHESPRHRRGVSFDDGTAPGEALSVDALKIAEDLALAATNPELARTQHPKERGQVFHKIPIVDSDDEDEDDAPRNSRGRTVSFGDGSRPGNRSHEAEDEEKIQEDIAMAQKNPQVARTPWAGSEETFHDIETKEEEAELEERRLALASKERGNILLGQNDAKGAVAEYTAGLQHCMAGTPLSLDLWNNRAKARLSLGDYEGAAADATKVLHVLWAADDLSSVDQEKACKALYRRASANQRMNYKDAARQDFQKLLALSPGAPVALRGLRELGQ
jgi:tetratricopeptide (TPR) repeat protein